MGHQCGCEIVNDDMRSIHHRLLLTVAVLAIFYSISAAYQISIDTTSNLDINELLQREKREVESFDDDEYPSASNQEEPSFWDRVVKVALKLFNKFVEWLNS